MIVRIQGCRDSIWEQRTFVLATRLYHFNIRVSEIYSTYMYDVSSVKNDDILLAPSFVLLIVIVFIVTQILAGPFKLI